MKWKTSEKREVSIVPANYSIDWDRKAPSKGAAQVKEFLKKHCFHDNMGEEFLIPSSGKLRIDFINWSKEFVIEFNGKGAHEWNEFFMKSRSGYARSIKRDLKKQELVELNGLKFVVITDADLPLTKKHFSDNYDIWL